MDTTVCDCMCCCVLVHELMCVPLYVPAEKAVFQFLNVLMHFFQLFDVPSKYDNFYFPLL